MKLLIKSAVQRVKAAMAPAVSIAKVPMRALQTARMRMVLRIMRSRNFLVVAFLTAIPELVGAVSATYKGLSPVDGVRLVWILWVAAALAWVLFILTLLHKYWQFRRKESRRVRKQ